MLQISVHLKPFERKGMIDLWDDTKISAGMVWKEEIQSAIEWSTVVVLLISADFLAEDFIAEQVLPKILRRAANGGTTILPLILAPCSLIGSGIDVFQTVNSPDHPLTGMTPSDQERILVKLVETIRQKLAI
jgi:TIR domain